MAELRLVSTINQARYSSGISLLLEKYQTTGLDMKDSKIMKGELSYLHTCVPHVN